MARVLIVGCGCRGTALGQAMAARGWQARGTTRRADQVARIEAAGIEPALADPADAGSVVDAIGGVTVVAWLMGTAAADAAPIAPIHGEALLAVLEELSDSGVRGLAYEAAGTVDPDLLIAGAGAVRAAGKRWRMPVATIETDPVEVGHAAWLADAVGVVKGLIGR